MSSRAALGLVARTAAGPQRLTPLVRGAPRMKTGLVGRRRGYAVAAA